MCMRVTVATSASWFSRPWMLSMGMFFQPDCASVSRRDKGIATAISGDHAESGEMNRLESRVQVDGAEHVIDVLEHLAVHIFDVQYPSEPCIHPVPSADKGCPLPGGPGILDSKLTLWIRNRSEQAIEEL